MVVLAAPLTDGVVTPLHTVDTDASHRTLNHRSADAGNKDFYMAKSRSQEKVLGVALNTKLPAMVSAAPVLATVEQVNHIAVFRAIVKKDGVGAIVISYLRVPRVSTLSQPNAPTTTRFRRGSTHAADRRPWP